jgi:hypothetical protein
METAVQYIGKEKYFKNSKHNKQFYQNNNPKRFSPCKIFKSIYIHGKKIGTSANFFHKYQKTLIIGVKLVFF